MLEYFLDAAPESPCVLSLQAEVHLGETKMVQILIVLAVFVNRLFRHLLYSLGGKMINDVFVESPLEVQVSPATATTSSRTMRRRMRTTTAMASDARAEAETDSADSAIRRLRVRPRRTSTAGGGARSRS